MWLVQHESPSSRGLYFLTISFGSCCRGMGPPLSPAPAAQDGMEALPVLPGAAGVSSCVCNCWWSRATWTSSVPPAGHSRARWLLSKEDVSEGWRVPGPPGPARGVRVARWSRGDAPCMVALLQLHPRGGWTCRHEGRLCSSLSPFSWYLE